MMHLTARIRDLFKVHPPALPFLFLTEMWERFGFYIVQGLLIFYMINKHGFSDSYSYSIVGAFTALAYMLSWIGGFFADEVLGFKKTIYLGGILLILGYSLLAVPYPTILFYALATIVMGTGFLKPNISSLLGSLYTQRDPRREAGFTIFYIGIYTGIVLATTTAGFVQEKFGWSATFFTAALGLVIGIFIFFSGRKFLTNKGLPPEKHKNKLTQFLQKPIAIVIVVGLGIFIIRDLLEKEQFASFLLIFSGCLLLGGFLIRAFFFPRRIRNKLIALLLLFIISILFWAVYFQMFFSVNLFIERSVDRSFFGIEIPAVFFISIQALAVIFFGIIFAHMWRILAERKKNPSIAFKFALALLIIGLAFLVLVCGIQMANESRHYLVNPIWIAFAYILVAIAELLLSAIGLSAVTVLAPPNLVGTLMGVWFVALGLGGELAGMLAKQAAINPTILNSLVILQYYQNAFKNFGFYAIGTGVLALVLTPIIRVMSEGKRVTWRVFFH